MLILKRKQNQRIFIHDEATGRRIGCILVTEIDSNVVRLGLSGESLAFIRDDEVERLAKRIAAYLFKTFDGQRAEQLRLMMSSDGKAKGMGGYSEAGMASIIAMLLRKSARPARKGTVRHAK